MCKLFHIAIFCLSLTSAIGQNVFEVTVLDTRSQADDYAPILTDSGFVMCSIRERANGAVGFTDAATNLPLSDLYWVPMKDWKTGTPALFSANLATPVNEGPATFSSDGHTICYTRNLNLPKKLSNLKSLHGQLGLFFSTLNGEEWSEPTEFVYNSTKYSVMHPALSVDGTTLIFASDMPGTLGGMDLFSCTKHNGVWSEPVNLGASINSISNEVFPTLDRSGTLYFSSDRDGSLGNLDILSAAPRSIGWSAPEFLPKPINSNFNDHSYSADPFGFSALFSSNRNGNDRIFRARRTVEKFRECAEQQANNYCYAARTYPRPITEQLPLDQIWDMGDGTIIPGNVAEHCYAKPGKYQLKAKLIDRNTGATFAVLIENELVINDYIQAFVTAPDTVRTGRALALDANSSNVPGSSIAEYHWDMGDSTFATGSRAQHKYATEGVYTVRLDLIMDARTDGVITNRCNTKTIVVLDRFRDTEDQAVVATYQDAAGRKHSFEFQELPYDQLMIVAMDSEEAVFAIELFASAKRVSLDDPRFMEVRKLYRVVERFDPERGVYTYSVGETTSMAELYDVYKKLRELEFLEAEVFALKVEKLVDLSELHLASLEDLANTKLVTNSIQFEYKSAAIGAGSDEVLNELTGLLRQHPQLQLVIEAHTDDIGGDQYNVELSQSRAASVVNYLTEKGVSETRLLPIGHGENQPMASNKTAEGRAMNRRVEFRMVVKGEEQAFQKTR